MKHDVVQKYYGETLQSSADLQTDACCTEEAVPEWLKPILSKIHDDVMMRYYGCGLIAPEALKGARVLDLGCGTGRDVYALSSLVGAAGEVVGVDMTDAQLDLARTHQAFHRDAFGLPDVNTTFLKGTIENLGNLGLQPGSFDVVVSNCVVNLAEDNGTVLRGVYDLLKPGGEMYFSDVYASRRIPQALRDDDVLYGECLSGALYINDFMRLARETGFDDPRLVKQRPLTIQNPALAGKLGQITFTSSTFRLFKLQGLEPLCEDYGQAVIYKETEPHAPDAFALDDHHLMETGKVFPVCGNTWKMLAETRLAAHFDFIGDFSTHYGLFDGCAPGDPVPQDSAGCC